jgi:hypothetical protein
MFLTGARDIAALKNAPALVMGRTAQWLGLRGFDVSRYAERRLDNF